MTRGGKRKGAGRPRTEPAARLRNDVRIRLTDEQMRRVEALERAGHSLRDILLAGVAALSDRRVA